MNFRRRADGRARIADAVLLADGDRRRNAVDSVDVGLFHPLEELTRVRGKRFHVPPLPFGVNRVEGERRLSRTADAGHDDQLAQRHRQVDVLEVMSARTAHDEIGGLSRRGGLHSQLSWRRFKPSSYPRVWTEATGTPEHRSAKASERVKKSSLG